MSDDIVVIVDYPALDRFAVGKMETLSTDWENEIKERNRDKSRLLKTLGKLEGSLSDWRSQAHIAKKEYEEGWHALLTTPGEDDWQEVVNILRAIKSKVTFASRNVTLYTDKIEETKSELARIISRIDWAKSEKAAKQRCEKWTSLSNAGFLMGDCMLGTKPSKGTPPQKLSVGKAKDGTQYFYKMCKNGSMRSFV